ncbi:MAG: leucyl aminopeptidase [Pseudomonadota bacterium]
MSASQAEMIETFAEVLALCGVNETQKVAVLTEGNIAQDYSEAFLAAAERCRGEAVRVNVAATSNAGAEARIADLGSNALGDDASAMATLKEADMVVDLMLLLFSKEQIEIQQAGARMLMVVEPFEILKRLMPTTRMRERVELAEARIAAAKILRFTNDAGTDVSYELKQFSGPPPQCILTEYGYTDTPGRWDHWPSGFLASTGTPTGVDGTVVMDVDDIVLPWKEKLTSPITFEIKDGYVKGISGGDDARRLNDYMADFEDPRAYAVSHIGWGLNENARWEVDIPGIAMDARAYYGNVLFSTGPDTEFGGSNDTPCHLDLPMRNCSLWLDDELIVKQGRVIPADMQPQQQS